MAASYSKPRLTVPHQTRTGPKATARCSQPPRGSINRALEQSASRVRAESPVMALAGQFENNRTLREQSADAVIAGTNWRAY
ncbi:hypothetical protein R1flu_019781 [Riccia fluitans]|uniref:Uncharacterized protein n=1 Tax=Riccia fluitans TaxID=41844 RepID=A0ABD1ZJN1_9MARC